MRLYRAASGPPDVLVPAPSGIASLAIVQALARTELVRACLLNDAGIAGMILYTFLQDHISGGTLVVLTLSLVVFAVHVPMLVGFTVARYADPDARVAA